MMKRFNRCLKYIINFVNASLVYSRLYVQIIMIDDYV